MALYKYVAPERIDILQHGLISFTAPSRLNDPFEMCPLFDKFIDESEVRARVKNAFNLSDPLAEKVLRSRNTTPEEDYERKTLQTSKILKEIITPYYRKCFYDRIDAEYGVLCLTERADNILMWSHYSFAHHGFVIEFDEQHPFFNQKSHIPGVGFLEKVKYLKFRPSLKSFNDITPFEMFFTKSEDWQYEQEWRIVRLRTEALEPFDDLQKGGGNLFKIPSDCIKGIIIGCKMTQENQEKLKNIIRQDKRYSSIRLSSVKPSERMYYLDIIPID